MFTLRNQARYELFLLAFLSTTSLAADLRDDEDLYAPRNLSIPSVRDEEPLYFPHLFVKSHKEEKAEAASRSLSVHSTQQLPSSKASEERRNSRLPFILQKENGECQINPFLGEEQNTLLQMNDLSYSLVKGHVRRSDEQMESLQREGWKIQGFTGLEGENPILRKYIPGKNKEPFGDLAGIICYNPKKSLMTIVYHGTATLGSDVAGWETNLDAEPISLHNLGLTLPGKIHQGFIRKYASTKKDVLAIIHQYVEEMSVQEKNDLKIVFTGHSQAGAVGNLALYDISANYGKELFGENFENKKDARFYGYFLSVPRVGDKDYVEAFHDKVGREFLIRQNVHGDPVTIGLGSKALGRTLGRVTPFFKKISIYKDSGYLFLDTGSDIRKRIRQNPHSFPKVNFIKRRLNFFAPYHYGYDSDDDRGAVFFPALVGRDVDLMFIRGMKH